MFRHKIHVRAALAFFVFQSVAFAADPAALSVMGEDYPRAFFFRSAEGWAANKRIPYARWEQTFERLMGIEGKVLEEEIPGRSERNIDFFTRFKKRHPDQLVLLHYNGNARDPRFQTEKFFAGHWVYYNGAKILVDVPAEAGETDIRVDNPKLFRVNTGRYRTANEDIGLCTLDARGRPNWHESEQVQLVSVDAKRGVIRVRRGAYGTRPRAFPAGRAYAAAHVTEGPWGRRSNLLWYHNYSTRCPRDAQGRTCVDVLVDDVANRFLPGGELEAFDGLEFDVLHNRAHGGRPGRGPDCDADGKIDNGVFNGINTYGIGVVEFCRRLRGKMGDRRLILADGMSLNNQRAFRILNGIESEGWPHLRDYEIRDWSGGLNRHFFWAKNARPPVFNYVNHKYNMPSGKPGVTQRPDIPFSTHRVAFAAAVFTDSAICYSFTPPKEQSELIEVWDELWMGREKKPGWLGRPLGPAVRMAERQADLLGGAGERMASGFAKRWSGENVQFAVEANGIRVSSRKTDATQLQFRLHDVPCSGPDLVAVVTARAAPRRGYPNEMARMMYVGIPSADAVLVRPGLPATGMCRRGGKETEILAESGASVRWVRRQRLGGEAHDCYMVHPPYKGGVGYTFWEREVRVPKDGRLEFFAGMGERAPGRSDGVVFRILAGEIRGGKVAEYTPLFEHTQIEARWTRHSVSLARWGGKTVRLRFVSDCGPKNNSTTDHSHWSDVRLLGPGGVDAITKPVRYMTWVNDADFRAAFYFSEVKSPRVDLEFAVEGSEPVWISAIAAHAHIDAMVREFERGLVVANPSPRSYTFDLGRLFPGRTFRRFRGTALQDPKTNDGAAVGPTLTLNARDALFLVRE